MSSPQPSLSTGKMFCTKLTTVSLLLGTWCWTSAAAELFHEVACPGVNPKLKCPDGFRIALKGVDYGLKEDADCSAPHQRAKVSTETGFHPLFFGWVGSICENEEYCRLPKPNITMFIQNWSPDNFIQISYTCEPETEGTMSKILCEGETETLTCETGELVILKAKYGRLDENTCTETPSEMTFCNSVSAAARVMDWCYQNGFTHTCTITANSDNLGSPQPCDTLPKYLSVDYMCAQDV
ncbi:L-rhamnose-binding lectin CSL3-like isoform X3 [Hippocampus comes]|uniref:L-rhamnose-binding lectin CSL3-like isoform X3 n=1 Tax=Hippocampus comes TaxID=109280 RepID=UPI00094E5F4B|nr:PREDICTED: L-rhamnose-binding lectin CSL3-like isoform X3 [Hippocampus comes]